MPGVKTVRGFQWPASDVACAAVVFDRLADLDLALAHVRAVDVAVQAGGNCGVWPKRLAARFRTVYTFEPHPENFACLVANCPEPNLFAFRAALGAGPGTTGLAYETDASNLGAVYVTGPGAVPVLPLDALALPRCDLVQLDIEGYELAALQGAAATLARCRPVLMLEHKLWLWPGRYPWTGADVEAWLTAQGYRCVAAVERDRIWVPEG